MLKELFIKLFYFNSITNCNIVNYQKVNEENNYKKLSRSFVRLKKIDYIVYERLTDQIIDEFGMSEESKSLYYLRRNLILMVCRYHLTDNRSLITKAEIKKSEILDREKKIFERQLKNNAKKMNSSNHRIISQWSNTNTRRLSIFEYYNYAKDYELENKKSQVA